MHPMPRGTWILTREEESALRDCAEVRARGVEAQVLPCIEFVDRAWPRWSPAPGTPVVFLTSRRAAQRYLEHLDAGELVAAVVPATKAVLDERGVPVEVGARGGAVPLAEALVAAWEAQGCPAWHVRYPTSDVALTAKEQALAMTVLARVGPVQREVVYETRTPAALASSLRARQGEAWSGCFHSPSAVRAFLSEAPSAMTRPTHVVCFGRSTQAEWNQHRRTSWPEAVLSSSIVETIVSLEESP